MTELGTTTVKKNNFIFQFIFILRPFDLEIFAINLLFNSTQYFFIKNGKNVQIID